MDFDVFRERLLRLETSCLCDVDKGLRVMDAAIRPLRLGLKLVGRAHTVVCDGDFLALIKALSDARPGEVLVVDTRGSRAAMAGELFSREALRKGLAGIVVDGAVRDTEKVRSFGIPVYSRSIIPVSGTTQKIQPTQVPVQCGGVTVSPGDIVFGDDDGLVVATEQQLAELVPLAENIQRVEEDALARMDRGESLIDMVNFREHFDALQAGRDSKLKFA